MQSQMIEHKNVFKYSFESVVKESSSAMNTDNVARIRNMVALTEFFFAKLKTKMCTAICDSN